MIANKESACVEVADKKTASDSGEIALAILGKLFTKLDEEQEKDKGVGMTVDEIKQFLSAYSFPIGKQVVENMQRWLPGMADDEPSMDGDTKSSAFFLTKTLKRKFSGHDPAIVGAVIDEIKQWLPAHGVEWDEERRHEEAWSALCGRIYKMTIEGIEALSAELDCRAAALA